MKLALTLFFWWFLAAEALSLTGGDVSRAVLVGPFLTLEACGAATARVHAAGGVATVRCFAF